VQCETSLATNETFEAFRVHFYSQPAYYKVTLTERITNPHTETSEDVWLYMVLFGEAAWQFAALLDPTPMAMYVDGENNWHAVFDIGDIPPGDNVTFTVDVIFALGVYESNASELNTGTLEDIPQDLAAYLREDEWWEVEHTLIRQKASELKKVEDPNAYGLAENILEFVGREIEYKVFQERRGALRTLTTKKGDCDGFSDLTIALSRAAGLPARMCMGWAYDEAELAGHAWVEFYLPPHGWQPTDPTWAKTWNGYLARLDSIHLLRSNWGLNSVGRSVWVMYYGAAPQLGESENLVVLSASEAAEEFIRAGEIAIERAEELVGQELKEARSYLDQARTAQNIDQKISLAQQAIGQANEVIRKFGAPPERPFQLPEWLIWFCVILIGIGAAATIAQASLSNKLTEEARFPLKVFKKPPSLFVWEI
jgi:hypothetical protein